MANSGSFKKGDGRARKPRGAKNRTTSAAKEAIELAAEGLGGSKRLIAWAKADPLNERVFWGQIYTKLLPLQVSGDPNAPVVPGVISIVFQQQPDSENRT